MELVEDLGANVNQCSLIKEYIHVFCNIGQCNSWTFNQVCHSLTVSDNQVYSDEIDRWPVYSGGRFRALCPSCLSTPLRIIINFQLSPPHTIINFKVLPPTLFFFYFLGSVTRKQQLFYYMQRF